NLSDIVSDEFTLNKLTVAPAMYLGSCRHNLPAYREDDSSHKLIFEQFVPKDLALKEEQEDFISHLTKIIESNLEKSELDVEFLAMQLNVSHSTLYRKVKGLTGLSITELVKKVRLHAAAKMLETSNMSVNEVADATGFSTPTYVRVNFKKEYGVSPSAYAKSKRI
ncbi:MAG: AraC family transcriptional regulator, partial [Bacteroidales bacterium]|nr:AraC family transcriptional regulator [Bacteroidales bacterium]